MSQNESTPFLVTDAKNLTLIDATRENSPWCNRECMILSVCEIFGIPMIRNNRYDRYVINSHIYDQTD